MDPGLEEAHSAICHHGKDQDGFTDLAEDGGGATHMPPGFAPDSHGFQGGGGHIHNIAGGMDTPTGFQHLTHHIGEGELK